MKPCDHSFAFEHFQARCGPGWAVHSRCVKCGQHKSEPATPQARTDALVGMMEEVALELALREPSAAEPPA